MRPAKPKSLGHKIPEAFSLIEVTIALGIFAFAIVAVMGLMAVSINSDRGAASDTVLARMAETVVADVRGKGFGWAHTNSAYADTNADFYFDLAGSASDASGNSFTAANAIYSCAVTRKASASTNVDYYILKFLWPVAAGSKAQTRLIHASLANYE